MKKNRIRAVTAVAAASLLAGCVTHSVSEADAEPIASAPAFERTTANSTEILLTRDSGILGYGSDAYVKVDGKNAARLRPSQLVRLYVAPGDHFLEVGAIYGTQAGTSTVTQIGKVRRFRVIVDAGHAFSFIPVGAGHAPD